MNTTIFDEQDAAVRRVPERVDRPADLAPRREHAGRDDHACTLHNATGEKWSADAAGRRDRDRCTMKRERGQAAEPDRSSR